MNEIWNNINNRLKELNCDKYVILNTPTSIKEINELESHIGITLPNSYQKFLLIHNGQDEDSDIGIIYQEVLLSVESIIEQWDVWCSCIDDDSNEEIIESNPKGFVKKMYINKKWIPITHDGGGNHIGIDYDPDTNGTVGQIIRFGADEETHTVLASSFEEFINKYTKLLEKSTWNSEYFEFTF
jgi:cell wall assembly regulator SMI1